MKRKVLIAIAVVFAVIMVLASVFIYEDQFKKREVYRVENPDNGFAFVLYQVGSPGWPFGPVKAEIRVVNSNGKTLDKEAIVIHTDGAQLSKYYIDGLRWYDTMLEVVCSGEDGTATYVLEFE